MHLNGCRSTSSFFANWKAATNKEILCLVTFSCFDFSLSSSFGLNTKGRIISHKRANKQNIVEMFEWEKGGDGDHN